MDDGEADEGPEDRECSCSSYLVPLLTSQVVV